MQIRSKIKYKLPPLRTLERIGEERIIVSGKIQKFCKEYVRIQVKRDTDCDAQAQIDIIGRIDVIMPAENNPMVGVGKPMAGKSVNLPTIKEKIWL